MSTEINFDLNDIVILVSTKEKKYKQFIGELGVIVTKEENCIFIGQGIYLVETSDKRLVLYNFEMIKIGTL